MKHLISLLLVLALLILPVCADTVSLPEIVPPEKQVLFDPQAPKPIAVSYRFDGEAGGCDSPLCTPEAVDAMIRWLSGITVGEITQMRADDCDAYIDFYYEDGTSIYFHFMADALAVGAEYYTVSRSSMPLVFPGYDASLSECPPESALAEFFARLDAGELPKTVKRGFKKLDPREFVEELSYMVPAWTAPLAQLSEDSLQPEATYVCVMEDGTQYSFCFAGEFLLLDLPEPLGTWAYAVPGSALLP